MGQPAAQRCLSLGKPLHRIAAVPVVARLRTRFVSRSMSPSSSQPLAHTHRWPCLPWAPRRPVKTAWLDVALRAALPTPAQRRRPLVPPSRARQHCIIFHHPPPFLLRYASASEHRHLPKNRHPPRLCPSPLFAPDPRIMLPSTLLPTRVGTLFVLPAGSIGHVFAPSCKAVETANRKSSPDAGLCQGPRCTGLVGA